MTFPTREGSLIQVAGSLKFYYLSAILSAGINQLSILINGINIDLIEYL